MRPLMPLMDSSQDLTKVPLHVDLLHHTLAPIPESGAVALVLAGLAPVGGMTSRRARRG
jgi:hypothetical protein